MQISHRTIIINPPVIQITCGHIHVLNLTPSSDASNVFSMLCHFANRWYMGLMGQFVPNLTFWPERAAEITAPTQTAPRNELYLKVAALCTIFSFFWRDKGEGREKLTPKQSGERENGTISILIILCVHREKRPYNLTENSRRAGWKKKRVGSFIWTAKWGRWRCTLHCTVYSQIHWTATYKQPLKFQVMYLLNLIW